MRPLSYHAYEDTVNKNLNRCNRRSDERPLVVNCTGNFVTSAEFRTDNADTRMDYYLLYISDGKLIVNTPSGHIEGKAGTFFIFPPGCRYQYTHPGGEIIDYMWMHFTGSSVIDILEKYRIKIFPHFNIIEPDDAITMRFQNIFNAFIRQDKFRDNELSLLLERLLISLARRLDTDYQPRDVLSKSISYINNHYNEKIKIPDLASLENLSTSRYNAIFHKVMNSSPMEYITKIRLTSACELLASTDIPIKNVATMVGYEDSHFFSRIFRNNFDISPSEYRTKK